MQYLCLVYAGDNAFDGMSERDFQRLTNDSLNYDDELRRRGHFIAASALQPVSSATTVQVRNGKTSKTDGPFAETKEHLGGFIFIEARNLDEAIKIAAGIPMARHGTIEVRPAMALERKSVE